MSTRVIAFLLAAVLAWAGFATKQLPLSLGSAGVELTAVSSADIAAPGDASDSVADHRLDDQPSQGHTETLVDLPGLVPVRQSAATPALRMSRPGPYALAPMPPPYLDGLQRPPSATDRVA